MASAAAYLTPSVLRWARESVGLSTHEVARELGIFAWQVEAAEQGVDLLTLRQAEKIADLYDRPLASLFMPEPPAEEPPEAQFRRLPGAPALPWPPAMRRLARRVRQRQDAAAELYDSLDEAPPWTATGQAFRGVARSRLSLKARARLGISVEQQADWADPVGYLPLRSWVDAVEGLGVLVMQDGSMDVETLRGFASIHATVPAIVVNTKDDPRARAFTVIHELGHVLVDASGESMRGDTEAWCDEFAGEVLVPRDALRDALASTSETTIEGRIKEIALRFGVTPLAAAVRVARTGLLPQRAVDAAIASIQATGARSRSPGGNYYRNKITWLGPAFIRLVLDAVDGQALTLSNAAGLLEAKVNHFDRLRQTVEARAEFG